MLITTNAIIHGENNEVEKDAILTELEKIVINPKLSADKINHTSKIGRWKPVNIAGTETSIGMCGVDMVIPPFNIRRAFLFFIILSPLMLTVTTMNTNNTHYYLTLVEVTQEKKHLMIRCVAHVFAN